MNVNSSKFKGMIKSKSFVVGACAVLAVAVLLVSYNLRIKNAVKPVKIPVAKITIQPRTKITTDMIEFRNIPQGGLSGNYFIDPENIVGRYSTVNSVIPQGSMFFKETVVSQEALPDSALFQVPKGETLYYLTVNMLTTYTNSVLPGNYIDLYMSTKSSDKALVGKLIKDIKVLAVKTSDGKNVFENAEESRTPYVIIFSLPEEQHLLLRKVNAINNYSVSQGNSGFARIELIPVPNTINYTDTTETVKTVVSSQFLRDHILTLSATVPEDVPELNFDTPNTEENTESNR